MATDLTSELSGDFQDIAAWINFLSHTPIPVLKHTARELEALKNDENKLSARAISSVVLADPFMVFKIISYAKKHPGRRQLQDLIDVEQAIIMMGTDAFFREIPAMPLIEDQLHADLNALTHLLRLVKRAHRAAHYAADWAAMHKDLHCEEIRLAALLHDFGEMLMWCFAPDKMKTIFAMQKADKTLRSKVVQEQVLGFKGIDLQKELIRAFDLPELLGKLFEDKSELGQRAKNVSLAVNLARHSANGWDDAALPDDYRDIAEFLHVDVERAKYLIGVPDPEASA